MPTASEAEASMQWLKDRLPEAPEYREVYLAPIYPKAGKISDNQLLAKIEKSKPKFVFIQLGGGTQERLGLFLKQKLSYKPAIICTGAALAFLSGQQARIPMWADHLFIGWFLRCIHQPKTFIPRYLKAFKLIYLLFKHGNNHPAQTLAMLECNKKTIIVYSLKTSSKPLSKRASVRSLGCRLNQSEGIALEGRLRAAGYDVVEFGEDADLGVINTCTVTNEADAKSRNAIRRFNRKNPEGVTVVVGCYSQVSANEVAMVEGVDYVIGNHDKLNFLDYLEQQKPRCRSLSGKELIGRILVLGLWGIPTLSNGQT